MVSFASNAVDGLGPYQVHFEALPTSADAEYVPRSVITVTRTLHQDTVSRELSFFTPGCGDVPAVSAHGGTYVALCGHLGGRHYTYRLFRLGGAGLESVTLDAFDRAFPLSDSPGGGVETMVLRRDELPGANMGPIYLPHMYRLRLDPSSFGFAPIYGAAVKSRYMDYYARTLEQTEWSQSFPALVAALMATEDPALICGEVKKLKRGWRGAAGEAPSFDDTLQKWSKQLPTLGYPTFDFTIC